MGRGGGRQIIEQYHSLYSGVKDDFGLQRLFVCTKMDGIPAWPNNTTALCQKDYVLNTSNYQMNTASEKVKEVLPLFDILKLWW